MRRLRAEIEIAASPERVWQVLTDFSALPEWNSFMQSAQDEPREGERIQVRLKATGGMGMTIKPTIIRADPGVELQWLGRLLVPGIFDGRHFFIIEPMDDSRVRFVQHEEFTGALVPLLMAMVRKSTLRGFQEMNQALKARAEAA